MLYFRCVKSVNHGTELVRELKNEFGKKSMLTTIDGNLVVVTEFDSNKMCERLTKLVNGVEYDIMFGQLLPDEAEQCNFNSLPIITIILSDDDTVTIEGMGMIGSNNCRPTKVSITVSIDNVKSIVNALIAMRDYFVREHQAYLQ